MFILLGIVVVYIGVGVAKEYSNRKKEVEVTPFSYKLTKEDIKPILTWPASFFNK